MSSGTALSIQNLSFTVLPYIVAYLITIDPSYTTVEMFFCLISLIGVACLFVLRRLRDAEQLENPQFNVSAFVH
jgi:hypothetical protein